MVIESRFTAERAAFYQLKQAMEGDALLKSDIETALAALLGRFATTIYENRFVVGGALEVIMVAALRAAGVDATDVGAQEERLDVRNRIKPRVSWSAARLHVKYLHKRRN